MLPERNICEMPMIAADVKGKVVSVVIDDLETVDRIASFEIPEKQAEQFALELEVLSASIRSLIHHARLAGKKGGQSSTPA